MSTAGTRGRAPSTRPRPEVADRLIAAREGTEKLFRVTIGRMQSGQETGRRLKAFAYLVAEKAGLYREIMEVFTQAKARFAVHLRPAEILAALPGEIDRAALDSALSQLSEWGNLEAHPDTADVATVEEFYRPRYLYQITAEGEAVEQAVASFLETISTQGELQTAALSDISSLLGELEVLAAEAEPDEGKVHRTLNLLRVRFEQLTSRAQSFITSLQRTIDLQGIEVDQLLAYKERLIEYLERFIGELILATAGISQKLDGIEIGDSTRLLEIAAERDLVDAIEVSDEDRQRAFETWASRWAGLRAWFIRGDNGEPSQAEVLRSRARSAIPALLNAVTAAHDRRTTRSDRHADLRTLARWFAEAETDRDAHRLWRAAFALAPARHLRITAETLATRDQSPIPADLSWLEAPAIEISPRLRTTGRHTRKGRPANVIDRSAQKAALDRLIIEQASQIQKAHARLASGRTLRLSELGPLGLLELDLFLDLLGEALAALRRPGGKTSATSTDGRLRIELEPTRDGSTATVDTPAGRFSGEDHLIKITRTFEHDEQVGPNEPSQHPAERRALRGTQPRSTSDSDTAPELVGAGP